MSAAMAQQVVDRVRADLPALVDHIARRMVVEIPFYAAEGAGSDEDLRQRLRANVHAALAALLGAPHDPVPPAETGRLRARQDAPLADVLSAYRLGYSEIWAAVLRAGRQPPAIPPDRMIAFAHLAFETHNRDADALIHAFRDEAQHLLLRHERERTALIDVLLSDEPGLGTLLDVVRALRMPMEGTFVVAAAASQLGQDPMPRVASALAAADVTSVWRLRYNLAVGVLSLPDSAGGPRALRLLARHATGPVGVSPIFTSLRRTSWALDLAQLVLRRQGGTTGVTQFQDSPLNMLVVGGRDAARETARAVLGGLLALPAETRDMLLQTLHAWVDAAGSVDRTGDRLHCHPNTVRKRLRRIEQYTGRNLHEPGGVAELVTASQAWTQLQPPDPRP